MRGRAGRSSSPTDSTQSCYPASEQTRRASSTITFANSLQTIPQAANDLTLGSSSKALVPGQVVQPRGDDEKSTVASPPPDCACLRPELLPCSLHPGSSSTHGTMSPSSSRRRVRTVLAGSLITLDSAHED